MLKKKKKKFEHDVDMLQGKFLAAFHRRTSHLTDNAYLTLIRAHFRNRVDKTHDAVVTDQGMTDKTWSDSLCGRPATVSNLNWAKCHPPVDQSSKKQTEDFVNCNQNGYRNLCELLTLMFSNQICVSKESGPTVLCFPFLPSSSQNISMTKNLNVLPGVFGLFCSLASFDPEL